MLFSVYFQSTNKWDMTPLKNVRYTAAWSEYPKFVHMLRACQRTGMALCVFESLRSDREVDERGACLEKSLVIDSWCCTVMALSCLFNLPVPWQTYTHTNKSAHRDPLPLTHTWLTDRNKLFLSRMFWRSDQDPISLHQGSHRAF